MAVDPSVVDITPANTWVLVALNVTGGYVEVIKGDVEYLCDHRDNGSPPPSDNASAVELEGARPIESDTGIDVYIKALNGVGKVKVSL